MIQAKLGRYLSRSLSLRTTRCASFAKFDYTDSLNFKSLLTEDELMVRIHPYRPQKQQDSSRKPTSSPESWRTIERRNSTGPSSSSWEKMAS